MIIVQGQDITQIQLEYQAGLLSFEKSAKRPPWASHVNYFYNPTIPDIATDDFA